MPLVVHVKERLHVKERVHVEERVHMFVPKMEPLSSSVAPSITNNSLATVSTVTITEVGQRTVSL